jgi:sarcosine oxidase, subunit beta
MTKRDVADLVVVGAGTVGGWASVFAAERGAGRVVVVDSGLVGQGASSRAAGVVRSQGGTPATVQLGSWSIDFYNGQRDAYGTDSGFRELGYLILAVTEKDEGVGRERVAMQRDAGLDVRWLGPRQARTLNPTLAATGHRGGSYVATDGCIDPPRNVWAYTLAMRQRGVTLRERTAFTGLRTARGRGGRLRVTGVQTDNGVIATERVLLTGGPSLRDVGRLVGARIFVGAARHQVVISEPHPAFDVDRQPMVFDVGVGLYWRLEEGGLLWGMSNPREAPGPARAIDWRHIRKMERRLHAMVPITKELGIKKAWAATIEYTPDHLPILGPVFTTEGVELEGASVASSCGHGMMWGPAVARCAADLALEGRTDVVDVSEFGMDRFDDQGRSPYLDPVALPFPVSAD